ncbi:hypothetical protein HRF55_10270 [Bacillus subtilis]|uniref:hypothetical protein n=1 Tax=Bacillus subtilis TaxID=1423 RepID=UPI001560E930|nr:hypothetical protein [Bacillus subtilis]NRF01180.1 hypothetical protein [Bacillus subtilis]NRG35471.1 hypothetical protein [Bacillus subtilis]
MTRFDELLAYLDRLIALQSAGHAVRKEITEVIAAIRDEDVLALNNDEPTVLIDGVTLGERNSRALSVKDFAKGVR